MAKDNESLAQSREIRANLLAKWGKLPSSIWEVAWGDNNTTRDVSIKYSDQQKANELTVGKSFAISGTGARHGALSRFPQDLCKFLVQFYSEEGETVLDPFAGHNSRMEAVWKCNRNYIGFDISKSFMIDNVKRRDELLLGNKRSLMPLKSEITLVECDSRNILDLIPENSADFCMTSPPFWNIEYYGPEAEQLGNSSYEKFLEGLQVVLQGCANALKPNCYLAWEVNDFREDGKFYTYHADLINMLPKVGLLPHDVVIVDYGSAFLQAFLSDVDFLKIMPKKHAYIIVGRKPGDKTSTRAGHRLELYEEAKNAPQVDDSQIRML